MRGLYSSKTEIRHKIFTEIARMAYEGQSPEMLEELPYKIVPGEIATYRESIFLERAVVGERLRVAMGMSLRKVKEHAPISKGVEASVIEEKYYEPPLINVIKFACNSCPEKRVMITEGCQGCLEHPCVEVCPKKAVHMEGKLDYIKRRFKYFSSITLASTPFEIGACSVTFLSDIPIATRSLSPTTALSKKILSR